MGLVLGGIPMLTKKVKKTKETKEVSSYVIMALTFALVMVLALPKVGLPSDSETAKHGFGFFRRNIWRNTW